jgi:hypothetical protein
MKRSVSHSERRALKARLNTIVHSQIAHQIARQKLARPRLPDLPLQILHRNVHVLVLDPRDDLLQPRRDLLDHRIDALRGDGHARVREARAVVHPLPQLHPRDLGRGGVLHEVVERDAPVPPYPGGGVGETRLDVLAHAFGGDLAGNIGVEQIGSGDLDIGAEVIVLNVEYQCECFF